MYRSAEGASCDDESYQRSAALTRLGLLFRAALILWCGGDSRHGFSRRSSIGFFRRRPSPACRAWQGCEPELAAAVVGRRARRHEPHSCGADWRHGPSDAARLGDPLQRRRRRRLDRPACGRHAAAPVGGWSWRRLSTRGRTRRWMASCATWCVAGGHELFARSARPKHLRQDTETIAALKNFANALNVYLEARGKAFSLVALIRHPK